MNFVMNHAPGAGSIAGPVNQQFSALPVNFGCPVTVLIGYVTVKKEKRERERERRREREEE